MMANIAYKLEAVCTIVYRSSFIKMWYLRSLNIVGHVGRNIVDIPEAGIGSPSSAPY